jgi:GntR family transcriptional regulator
VLNPASPIPLYQQLAELLGRRIASGDYAPGSRIPSEPELAAAFAIGRPTVRQATEALVRRGLLERRRGTGTFVLEKPPEVDLFSLGGTIRAFRDRGLVPETTWLDPIARRAVSAKLDHPFAGREALCASRLSRIQGQPVLLEQMALEPELFPGLETLDVTERSLSELARERYFLEPVAARQAFAVVRLDAERAHLLDRKRREPVLLVRRTLDFVNASGGVYAELYCVTDRVVFSQTLEPRFNRIVDRRPRVSESDRWESAGLSPLSPRQGATKDPSVRQTRATSRRPAP